MTLDKILVHAGQQRSDQAVVWRDSAGDIAKSNYGAVLTAAKRFSAGLISHDIGNGDRVATMMWNNYDHVIAWYGTMGIGAVVHTLNPRLHADQISWIAAHGGASVLVIESEFRNLVESIASQLPALKLILVSTQDTNVDQIASIPTMTLDSFLTGVGDPIWGAFDEETAAGLCYTSGTTGDPKGVLYSHRSNFLHALAVNQPNGLAISSSDVVLPVVPMFHANAWALAFVAPMAGAELVLPGRHLDGASLAELINDRGVTVAVGVPTIWEELLRHLRVAEERLPSLRRLVVGGSAVSPGVVSEFAEKHFIEIVHAWGMTEMSPLGTITSAGTRRGTPSSAEKLASTLRQGNVLFPVEAEIFDDAGAPCPHDDIATGALKARGPTVVRAYFGAAEEVIDQNGWFDTGDVAVIDTTGSMRLVDRSKDVIKSGGEWISSIELENLAMTHPGVKRAAVIAVPDERWGERPLLFIEAHQTGTPTPLEMVEHLRPSVPKWWIPSHFAYFDIPLGATGKIDKKALRSTLSSNDGPKVIAI